MRPISNTVFYYTAPGRLELVEEQCPPPEAGQVRCRTICSLVSIGTEMICFKGEVEPGSVWEAWIKYPFEPGYNCLGEVIDIGEGVTALQVGDRVCSPAPHREYFLDSAETAVPVPEGIPPEQAAWFFMNIIAQNGIRQAVPVMGESAVVIGLGMLGQLACRYLGLCGLSNLLAVDPLASRCKLAEGCGPTEVVCTTAEEIGQKVMDLTGGNGADVVFDITGHPSAFHSSLRMLGKRGRLGLIGDVPFPSKQTLTHDLISKSISIVGAHGSMPPWKGNCFYRWGKHEMSDYWFGLILSGRFSMEGLNTHRITPAQAPETYTQLLEDRSPYLGVVIDWR